MSVFVTPGPSALKNSFNCVFVHAENDLPARAGQGRAGQGRAQEGVTQHGRRRSSIEAVHWAGRKTRVEKTWRIFNVRPSPPPCACVRIYVPAQGGSGGVRREGPGGPGDRWAQHVDEVVAQEHVGGVGQRADVQVDAEPVA